VSDSPGAKARSALSTQIRTASSQDEDEDALGEEEVNILRTRDEVTSKVATYPRFLSMLITVHSTSLSSLTISIIGPSRPVGGPKLCKTSIPAVIFPKLLDPTLVAPSNLTPVRAQSEHPWEDDANGLLPRTPGARKEPSIIDVDMDEDETDEDLLNESSSVVSSQQKNIIYTREDTLGRRGV